MVKTLASLTTEEREARKELLRSAREAPSRSDSSLVKEVPLGAPTESKYSDGQGNFVDKSEPKTKAKPKPRKGPKGSSASFHERLLDANIFDTEASEDVKVPNSTTYDEKELVKALTERLEKALNEHPEAHDPRFPTHAKLLKHLVKISKRYLDYGRTKTAVKEAEKRRLPYMIKIPAPTKRNPNKVKFVEDQKSILEKSIKNIEHPEWKEYSYLANNRSNAALQADFDDLIQLGCSPLISCATETRWAKKLGLLPLPNGSTKIKTPLINAVLIPSATKKGQIRWRITGECSHCHHFVNNMVKGKNLSGGELQFVKVPSLEVNHRFK